MKRLLLIALLAMFTTSAFADRTLDYYIDKYPGRADYLVLLYTGMDSEWVHIYEGEYDIHDVHLIATPNDGDWATLVTRKEDQGRMFLVCENGSHDLCTNPIFVDFKKKNKKDK